MPPTLNPLWRYLRALAQRFKGDDGFRLAASLSYTTLLAIVPMVAVGLAVFSAFPAFEMFTGAIQEFLSKSVLPPTVASRVLDYVDQFARNAAQLTALGAIFVALTAFLLMGTIEKAFNDIWRAQRNRPLTIRLLMYWSAMTLGPLAVGVSLTITSYVMARWIRPALSIPWATEMLLYIVPFALLAGGLTLLYVVVPTRAVRWRDALIGALIAALVFEIVKVTFAAYLTHVPTYAAVYGALAVVPIFLVWIYLSWVIVIVGAEIAASLPDYRYLSTASGASAARANEAILARSLGAIACLVRGLALAKPVSVRLVAEDAATTLASAESTLEALAAIGVAGRVDGDRWTLLCDPDEMSIVTVVAKLNASARDNPRGGPIGDAIAAVNAATDRALNRPLRSLA